MQRKELFEIVDAKEVSKDEIASWVMKDQDLLDYLFDGLSHKKANVKYGCEKVLRILSEKAPEVLYPHYYRFVDNLDSENKFHRLGAIMVIANLSVADKENKFADVQHQYLNIVRSGDLTSAGNVIKSLPKIVSSYPNLLPDVTELLIEVEKLDFDTIECRNIALGHTISSFAKIYPQVDRKERVLQFIIRQTNNGRSATKKKAEKFVSRFQ